MKGGVVALGNFDGVHLGHRVVASAAIEKARLLGVRAAILTFEPHPRTLFQPTTPPFRLTPFQAKERLLREIGVDEVVALPFTTEFSQLSAEEFVSQILLDRFEATHVVAGHDFVYGYKRSGDMERLADCLSRHGVDTTAVRPAADKEGNVYSSSRIRMLLKDGSVTDAAEILGRSWSIGGRVVEGAKRGRTIGVPTANIGLGEYIRPKPGVYAVQAGRFGEPLSYRGVANIGTRPTVGGVSENLEAHLFDFDDDIYGESWEFALTHFIRPEQQFGSFELLKDQIQKDIADAKLVQKPS